MTINNYNKTTGSRAQLREDIISGKYLPGTVLPSARDLAAEMKVSKSLIHNILKLLEEEGLITTHPGRGSLVAKNINEKNKLSRFFLRPSDFGTFGYFPVAKSLLHSIAAGAEKKNTEIMLSFSDSSHITEEIISHYNAGTIQGLIYFQCASRSLIEPLVEAKVPYVIASDANGYTDLVCTYIDFREVARKAVRYLAKMGHKNIGMISGPKKDYLYSEMSAGFRGALAEEDLIYNPNWVLNNIAYEQPKDQVKLLREYLTQDDLPTAIFTTRSYRAKWLYEAAKLENISIPNDISVISFDHHTWEAATDNELTVITEPLNVQGELAVSMLQSWVQTNQKPISQKVEPELIERKSVIRI